MMDSDEYLHDMVKLERESWKYIHEQIKIYNTRKEELPKSVIAYIINYYEYLAYLILTEKINMFPAKQVFKPNILGIYKDFKEEFQGDRSNLKQLAIKWGAK